MGSYRIFVPMRILYGIQETLPYLWVTFAVVISTMAVSLLFGGLLAFCKVRGKITKYLANVYTLVFRCIPSIVLLFLVYYGLPQLILRITGYDMNFWNKGIFVVLSFSLNFSASISEIMRAAYESVDAVQQEAALCVGLSGFQTFWRIVFPQALAYALPNLANTITALMKEGAVAYTIGLIDIMGAGQNLIKMNYGAYTVETYLGLFIMYWIMTKLIEVAFDKLDKILSKGRRTVAG